MGMVILIEHIQPMGMVLLTEHMHEEAGFFLSVDQIMVLYLCVLLALFGLIWGSFADCAVSRWAAGEKMFGGRSRCFSCGHILGVLDLIPVVSWLVRRGKCRYCGEKIPADCLVAELVGAAAFVLVGLRFAPDAELGIWYFFYSGKTGLLFTALALVQWTVWAAIMLALALTDAAKRIIPNGLLIALAVNRVLWFFLGQEEFSVALDVLKACIVPAVLLILVLLVEKLMEREVMGGGDIKLLFALALYLTWVQMLLMLLVACVLGLIFAAVSQRKRGTAMPFGPFLAAAALVVVCFGEPVIQWYFSLF